MGDAVVAAAHLLNLTILAWLHRPLSLLDMDYEVNLPTWYATVQLAVVGCLLGVLAWTMLRRRAPRAWALFLPAALAFYLSLDEFTQLHERLRPMLQTTALPFSGAWMAVAVPVFVAAVLLVVGLTRHYWRPRPAALRAMVGVGLFGVAAGLLEIPHNFVEPNGPVHLTLIFVEEGLELLAVTLVLWAVYEVMHWHGIRFGEVPPSDG